MTHLCPVQKLVLGTLVVAILFLLSYFFTLSYFYPNYAVIEPKIINETITIGESQDGRQITLSIRNIGAKLEDVSFEANDGSSGIYSANDAKDAIGWVVTNMTNINNDLLKFADDSNIVENISFINHKIININSNVSCLNSIIVRQDMNAASRIECIANISADVHNISQSSESSKNLSRYNKIKDTLIYLNKSIDRLNSDTNKSYITINFDPNIIDIDKGETKYTSATIKILNDTPVGEYRGSVIIKSNGNSFKESLPIIIRVKLPQINLSID